MVRRLMSFGQYRKEFSFGPYECSSFGDNSKLYYKIITDFQNSFKVIGEGCKFNLVSENDEKCKNCTKCAQVCPRKIIEVEPLKKYSDEKVNN